MTTAQTILYKLDSTGNIREWCCWTEDNKIFIRYGRLNGEKIFEKQELPTHQEASEHARRRIRKQKERKGYTEKIPTKRVLMPMLAHRFQDHALKLPENVLCQPKLNGYRCLGSSSKMHTRTNVGLPAFPHIQYCLSLLSDEYTLDGEIYNHNTRLQRIMKSRSAFPTQESFAMEYHIYDIVEEIPYSQRRVIIADLMIDLQEKYEKSPFFAYKQPLPFPLMTVRSYSAKREEVQNYHDKFVAAGYEGAIIRNPEGIYEIDTRSYDLQKYKEREQEYYKIIDVIPGKKRNKEGVFVCQMADGTSFDCTPKATRYTKLLYLQNPLMVVGKYALVEYESINESGKPSQAVAIEVVK